MLLVRLSEWYEIKQGLGKLVHLVYKWIAEKQMWEFVCVWHNCYYQGSAKK